MRPSAALLSAVIVLGCGGSDPYSPPGTPNTPTGPKQPAPATNSVNVMDNSYSPSTLTVGAGTTITWTWTGSYAAHSVTFADGVNSAPAQTSGTHQRTFATAGTYNYQCSVHGAAMSGSVTVTP